MASERIEGRLSDEKREEMRQLAAEIDAEKDEMRRLADRALAPGATGVSPVPSSTTACTSIDSSTVQPQPAGPPASPRLRRDARVETSACRTALKPHLPKSLQRALDKSTGDGPVAPGEDVVGATKRGMMGMSEVFAGTGVTASDRKVLFALFNFFTTTQEPQERAREVQVWRNGHDRGVLYELRLPQEGNVLELAAKPSAPFTGQGIGHDLLTGGLVGINRAGRRIIFAAAPGTAERPLECLLCGSLRLPMGCWRLQWCYAGNADCQAGPRNFRAGRGHRQTAPELRGIADNWRFAAMSEANSQELLQKLSELIDLSPDVRFGQLLANLGFLVEARAGKSLWDIEGAELLQVMEEHRAELAERLQPSATRRSS